MSEKGRIDCYRYGFNGMEKDDEMKGAGNSYDFGARMYDSRLGRWLSIDKKSWSQPSQSPYKAFFNSPLIFTDPDGNYEFLTIIIIDKSTGATLRKEVPEAQSARVKKQGMECHSIQPFENGGRIGYCKDTYYDFETIITMTIDEEGKRTMDVSYKIIEDNGIRDSKIQIGPFDNPDFLDEPSGYGKMKRYQSQSRIGGCTFYSKNGKGYDRKGKSWGSLKLDKLLELHDLFDKAGAVNDVVNKTSSLKKEFFNDLLGKLVISGVQGIGEEVMDRIHELQRAKITAQRIGEERGKYIEITTSNHEYKYVLGSSEWSMKRENGEFITISENEVEQEAKDIATKIESSPK